MISPLDFKSSTSFIDVGWLQRSCFVFGMKRSYWLKYFFFFYFLIKCEDMCNPPAQKTIFLTCLPAREVSAFVLHPAHYTHTVSNQCFLIKSVMHK